ncbi:(Fe-S)-cluster assembly protein [Serratia marcescens]|jgi:DNA-binding MurR/RpiR family transcriptional regulator|uniref:RpiR family transcriptional regulator n=16 Tax=Enterobacterales TaxID=91347 RepID=A0A0F6KV02_SERMA|nr:MULTISPECIES: MurR/RpiR family transcriptional regulator [Enterobacterales]KAB5498189.1 MurR/RpiR family transcriptional regulator [Enterobacter sp. RJAL6]KLE36662.1 Fe-S cluster assembly protein HesB [Serratia sp. TEL]MDI6931411.1 MurR/RpiR family transcriptional regulator [Serratia sp. Se-PFBMAAmG]QHI80313.1 SIS domain-containing protein [Serratia sp. NGAS9]WIF06741.1 MurR/RpiR family transcriptional regulator [Serratia sp. B1]SAQ10584.1 transcriptional regulator of the myo-inositol cata
MNNPTQLSLLQDEIRHRYETLSKRLKQVARYILDNSNSIAFDTVASIAAQASVPPSTLIRFANAFGFSGFNEMKQVFRQHLMEETVNYTERARLFRQTSTDDNVAPEKPAEILNVFTMVNAQALQQLAMQIAPEQLDRAVELLNNAENIYVIGLRRSFSVASYLTYALRHLERRAFLIDGLGGMFTEQLSMVKPKDVVIAISYSPYAREAVELVELGAKRGAQQIAITDSQVSPLAAFSDVCFVVREAQVDGFRSQVASMCLAQTLAVSLALNNARDE